ncbi:molybdate ABC transporter permease subunit [Neobacillus thermocopriae]|uniref:molybdate ABC transporter permease subunit n=1 Tax=Neobacillus thermocopriae TaxID=1215031 RepID=UPI002E1CBDC6|nr:molybdate ABC transporter permease subunit [Neobacillus thermocopriae]MED3625560.1 molybdate ABC transporter permease subunit [Neobacillus thermocopriae]MED3715419.1 molybdate ABC transporter permease subunit [Neobacillus thermocopriae]
MVNDFWPPIILSLKVASISSGISLLFGVILGRILADKNFKGKMILETFLLMPIVLPPTVIGFLLIFFFGRNSPIGSFVENFFETTIIFTPLAAVIASTVVAFPLMYQTVKTGFQSVNKDIEEAARVDGATELNVFLHVTLPLSFKSIITGLILSFARALGEFGATLMFAGNIPGKTQTAPTAIYIAMETGNLKLAWLLVGAMVFISFLMLFTTTIAQSKP